MRRHHEDMSVKMLDAAVCDNYRLDSAFTNANLDRVKRMILASKEAHAVQPAKIS